MKLYFFSLIMEKIYCRNNIDKYGLIKVVFTFADSLDRSLVIHKYKNLDFEPQIIFCNL